MIIGKTNPLSINNLYIALHKKHTHMGLVYVFNRSSKSSEPKLFHWKKDHFVSDNLTRQDYELCNISLPDSNNSRVVLFTTLLKIKNKSLPMPYGYLYKKHAFDKLGKWVGDGDEGRTCVTAIIDLFESSEVLTVQSNTWPINQNLCIKYLNDTRTGDASKNHAVQKQVSRSSTFICPIELCAVMSRPASERPINYINANTAVDNLLTYMKKNNSHHQPFDLRNLTFNNEIQY